MIRSAALSSAGLVATFLAAALLALLPLAAPAQPPVDAPKTTRVAEGTAIFRDSLRILKFKPLQQFSDLDPNDCILIMLGDTSRLTEVPGGLKQFLQRGGAAFIASDKPMQPGPKQALVDATGVTITGYTWSSSPDPAKWCYRGKDFCPYVQPTSNDSRLLRDAKTGVPLRIATNMPSTLKMDFFAPNDPRRFAMVPDETGFEFEVSRDAFRPGRQSLDALLGFAGDIGSGRYIVLADHSIFIDEMMKPTDNNNVEFTANCLTYLRGEHNQRKRVLFVDDGVIHTSFERGPKKSLSKKLDDYIKEGNKSLNEWQDHLNEIDRRDGFNKRLWDYTSQNDRERVRKLIVLLMVLATLGLLMYGCYRLGIASRYKKEPSVPALARVAGQQGPRGSPLEQRHASLLDAQNLWEAGRQLARDAFEAGGVAAPVPYREPAVKLKGVGWWRGFGLRRRVLLLWRLAFLNKPMRLAPHAIRALVAELEHLKVELKRGTIRLT